MTTTTETLEVVEVVEDIFNLKEPLLISNNIEKRDDLQVAPAPGQNTINGAVTIAFEVNNTQNYLLPCVSGLKVAGKFTKADGATPIVKADLELVNNWGWCLFERAGLEMGGREVERIDDVRNATSLIGHCLKSKIYKSTYGELDTWIPDSGDNTAAATNLGWVQRTNVYYNTNGTFEIFLKLSDLFGFCDVHKLIYLIPMRLTLVRSSDDKYLFFNNAAPTDNSKIVLTDIKWVIPTIIPSNERKTAITKLLTSNDYIPWTFLRRSTSYWQFTAGQGGTWIFKTTTNNPRYILIAFKSGTNLTSDYVNNNTSFDHAGVTEIQVDLNGSLYPVQPLKGNFTSRQVVDFYRAYCNFCLKNGIEPPLSLNEWINFYPVHVVDTSALSPNIKTNSVLIKIEVRRDSTSTAATGYCLLYEDEDNKRFKVGEGRFLEYQ